MCVWTVVSPVLTRHIFMSLIPAFGRGVVGYIIRQVPKDREIKWLKLIH